MHAAKFLVTIALRLTATLAQAAGFRFIDVPADADGPALKGAIWAPCSEPPDEINLGNIAVPGVKDCPISGDKMPLVVVSHGRGGSFIGHHDTAETLADAGFIVATINHPGDTVSDMNRSDDLSVSVERPADIKRLIDFMLAASPVASKIDSERIGFFGFSRGGYTGLVLIAANPDWAIPLCQRSSGASICEQILRKDFRVQPLAHDPRIKAAVIADPFSLYLYRRQLYGCQGADSVVGVGTRGRRRHAPEHRRGGPKPAGEARVPRGGELRTFRLSALFARNGEKPARALPGRAGRRPRRLPQTIQWRCARILSDTSDAGTATMITPDRPPIGSFAAAAGTHDAHTTRVPMNSVQRHFRAWRRRQSLQGAVFVPLWIAGGEAHQFGQDRLSRRHPGALVQCLKNHFTELVREGRNISLSSGQAGTYPGHRHRPSPV